MKRLFSMMVLVIWMAALSSAETPAGESERIQELEKKVEELQRQLAALKQQTASPETEEIRRQLSILAEEIEKLRSGEEEVELSEAKRRSLGLGPSAASVYTRKEGVSIAGYGEMLYENFDEEVDAGEPSGRIDQIDFLRAIVYVGYRFSDKILFNSEIEFEHASTGGGGEVSVEFAHIDYVALGVLTLRGGLVLIPMGFLNEWHEPTSFLGARRPVTETVILPSTWRENGFGIVGRKGIVDYRAYLVNGLNAAGFSSSGLRDGRQDGARAKIENPTFVGRVDVSPTPGLFLGGSFYGGNSGVFGTTASADLDVSTLIGEGHVEYRIRGLEFRALYAQASLDDVAELNAVIGATGDSSVGETLRGGYFQAGYNVFAGSGRKGALIPYLRFEKVNTQADVPSGFSGNPARNQTIWTFGVQYKPIFNIVIKGDYQAVDNQANTGVDQWNLALGYSF
jgi:hypothetical protein